MKHFKSASKANAMKRLTNVRKAYANGGAVSPLSGGMDEDDDPYDADDVASDMSVDGVATRQRLDRPSPKKSGRTNIVINVQAPSKPDMPNLPPIPPVVPPNVPPIAGTPTPPPIMPPPDPSMMQRKNGGRVIKHAAGGGLGRIEKAKAYGCKPAKGK